MNDSQTLVYTAHGLGQFFGAHVLQQVSGSTRFQCAAQISRARERGHNHDASSGAAAFQFSGHTFKSMHGARTSR